MNRPSVQEASALTGLAQKESIKIWGSESMDGSFKVRPSAHRVSPCLRVIVGARLGTASAVDAGACAREAQTRCLLAHARHARANGHVSRVLEFAEHPSLLEDHRNIAPPERPLQEGLGGERKVPPRRR